MDNAPYNSVLEKPLTWSCRKDEITWLQGKGIPLTEVSFKAQWLNLATASTSSRKRWDSLSNSSVTSKQIISGVQVRVVLCFILI